MFKTKIYLIFISLFVLSECQSIFDIRGQQTPFDSLPFVGVCDRIARKGVANCLENFLPTNVLSSFTGGPRSGSGGDICCSYSKYRACISGLHAGLAFAMERAKCPKSYSTRIITSMGDTVVGGSVTAFCGNGGGGSKCPKNTSTKPKKNQNPNRRKKPQNPNNDNSVFGFNPFIAGENPYYPGNTRRNGNSQSIFTPVRDLIDRGRQTVEHGVSSIFGGINSAMDSISSYGRYN